MGKGGHRQEAISVVADALGRLIEFWGFKRTMGRIWATLYLAPEPLPAAELCDRLDISVGAASTSLAELERWGVVHRLHKDGERREYFEPETNLWKMVSRVYEEREKREIERLIAALEAALSRIHHATDDAESKFVNARLQRLLFLAKTGRTLLESFLGGAPADPRPVRDNPLD